MKIIVDTRPGTVLDKIVVELAQRCGGPTAGTSRQGLHRFSRDCLDKPLNWGL